MATGLGGGPLNFGMGIAFQGTPESGLPYAQMEEQARARREREVAAKEAKRAKDLEEYINVDYNKIDRTLLKDARQGTAAFLEQAISMDNDPDAKIRHLLGAKQYVADLQAKSDNRMAMRKFFDTYKGVLTPPMEKIKNALNTYDNDIQTQEALKEAVATDPYGAFTLDANGYLSGNVIPDYDFNKQIDQERGNQYLFSKTQSNPSYVNDDLGYSYTETSVLSPEKRREVAVKHLSDPVAEQSWYWKNQPEIQEYANANNLDLNNPNDRTKAVAATYDKFLEKQFEPKKETKWLRNKGDINISTGTVEPKNETLWTNYSNTAHNALQNWAQGSGSINYSDLASSINGTTIYTSDKKDNAEGISIPVTAEYAGKEVMIPPARAMNKYGKPLGISSSVAGKAENITFKYAFVDANGVLTPLNQKQLNDLTPSQKQNVRPIGIVKYMQYGGHDGKRALGENAYVFYNLQPGSSDIADLNAIAPSVSVTQTQKTSKGTGNPSKTQTSPKRSTQGSPEPAPTNKVKKKPRS